MSHLALLALRLAARPRWPQLAETLLQHPALVDTPDAFGVRLRGDDWRLAERQRRALNALGLQVLPVWEWPKFLRRVKPLAPVLFVRGAAEALRESGCAIVGARQASPGARRWAALRARQLASAGVTIVSGGARGIDSAAHWGAVEAGGKTVAFVGTAVDRVYPRSNRALFAQIMTAGGAIVSEYAPCESLPSWSHAKRNRFIAAASRAVYVAEAGERSGALGTARFARRMGVPVMVAPPEVGGERAGLDYLLRSGQACSADEHAGAPPGLPASEKRAAPVQQCLALATGGDSPPEP